MRNSFFPILVFLFLFPVVSSLMATHNRAGEITLTRLDELSYEITITTFTYTLSQADRDMLEVQWGDNTFSFAERVSATKLPNFYQKNIYKTRHTFPGPGVFEIVVQDPNRNKGVKNIPNSVNVVFSIKTTILINPTLGSNSTPILLNPPIDRAAYRQVFIHNPAAYDPDGDSISYKLTVCTEQNGRLIEGYTLPPASDTLFVNPYTGDLTWITPNDTGIFNIAMDVEEWRSGVKIGNIVRDMQIEVYNTNNTAPLQNDPGNYCIEAGQVLEFPVVATDEDLDSINQWATGGPFVVEESPSTYEKDYMSADLGYSKSYFRWQTNCSHVRKQYYTVVFKAEDSNRETPLVDIRNVNVRVLGKAPAVPDLIPGSSSITLNWNADSCSQVQFYEIYRNSQPVAYVPDTCTGGMPAYTGYKLIGQTTGRLDTLFVDDNGGQGLQQGNEYCYVLVSVYPDGAQSFPSGESCSPLVEGAPSILEVSVTDYSERGSIRVVWAKPRRLDTIPANGPYEYLIYRSPDLLGTALELAGSFTTASLDDTTWVDSEVNTLDYPWSYSVKLFNNTPDNRFLIGRPESASSLYPELTGSDNNVRIEAIKNVPWINYHYSVYRQDPQSLDYDSVGYTTTGVFVDEGLENGSEYCYRLVSSGWRILDDLLYENSNISHYSCTTPVDSIPPCPPDLSAYSACDDGYNHLSWAYDDDPCSDEVSAYVLYFSPTAMDDPLELIRFDSRADSAYDHYTGQSLTGCYYITALDSTGNESRPSVTICLDECSNYVLPNVFSPNNDGINDIYRPFRASYVEKVNMRIFNRWGLLVFETEDPDINWDGKLTGSTKLVSPGVYYYICDVHEQRLSGLEVSIQKGFIHVYSGEENDTTIETK